MKDTYTVTHGNVGTIYDGHSSKKAAEHYAECVNLSKTQYGKFGDEAVTLLKNGEPIQEHTPPNRYRLSIAQEPFAFPGGYPRYAITDDGAALCCHCCVNEAERIDHATDGDGFNIIATDINWEDPDLFCDHCGKRIEEAYPEEE